MKTIKIIFISLLLSGCAEVKPKLIDNSIEQMERCADRSKKPAYTKEYTDKSLDDKLEDGNPYVKFFRRCELELRNTPKAFKYMYGKSK